MNSDGTASVDFNALASPSLRRFHFSHHLSLFPAAEGVQPLWALTFYVIFPLFTSSKKPPSFALNPRCYWSVLAAAPMGGPRMALPWDVSKVGPVFGIDLLVISPLPGAPENFLRLAKIITINSPPPVSDRSVRSDDVAPRPVSPFFCSGQWRPADTRVVWTATPSSQLLAGSLNGWIMTRWAAVLALSWPPSSLSLQRLRLFQEAHK